ncbi:MAG: FxLYD domain-containing protein [Candidatus Kariarchaeaceae archaeon]|jgi:hypothetical protein
MKYYSQCSLLLIVLILLILSCENPDESKNEAKIVLDGELNIWAYIDPFIGEQYILFDGFVKNIGDAVGYNCTVEITCFDENDMIIDVANGNPADGGDIGIGERVAFTASCTKLDSVEQVKRKEVSIDYSSR